MKPTLDSLATASPVSLLPPDLDQQVQALMKDAQVPGLSLAIFSKTGIVYSQGYGQLSKELAQPVDETTIFCAASLGKPVFAYAVLRLADAGLLDLEQPLYKLWPHPDLQHDQRHRLITARMVLEHTTGLPNWREGGRLEFLSEPGSEHTYSGEGFLYLMTILEKKLDKTLDEMMQEWVFEPLGMRNSSYVWQERYENNFAYSHNEKGYVLPRYKPAQANAAYSLQTTARDYAQLMRALMNGTGISTTTAEALFYPAVELARSPVDDSSIAWGLGIGLLQMPEANYCWQWGGHNWFASLTMAMIEEGVGLVYFSNSINGFGLGKYLIELCLGQENTPAQWLGDYDYRTPFKKLTRDLLSDKDFKTAIAPYWDAEGGHHRRDLIGEEAMESLGLLCNELGERKKAQQLLACNFAAYPESATAAEYYATACMMCREQEKAAKYYDRAFQLDASRSHCQENAQRLRGEWTGNVVLEVSGHANAEYLTVAGEFNNWNPIRHPFMRQNGSWYCPLQLEPGTYQYKIIVDGIWILDPHNPKTIYEQQYNSVLEVV